MKKILLLSAALIALCVSATRLVFNDTTYAATNDNLFDACSVSPDGCGDKTGSNGETLDKKVPGALNVVYGIIGILAVGYIIYGGVKYSLSAGDSSKMTSAKNTIIYAIVGLIVALSAFAITTLVTTVL